jgi:hypothetical protein
MLVSDRVRSAIRTKLHQETGRRKPSSSLVRWTKAPPARSILISWATASGARCRETSGRPASSGTPVPRAWHALRNRRQAALVERDDEHQPRDRCAGASRRGSRQPHRRRSAIRSLPHVRSEQPRCRSATGPEDSKRGRAAQAARVAGRACGRRRAAGASLAAASSAWLGALLSGRSNPALAERSVGDSGSASAQSSWRRSPTARSTADTVSPSAAPTCSSADLLVVGSRGRGGFAGAPYTLDPAAELGRRRNRQLRLARRPHVRHAVAGPAHLDRKAMCLQGRHSAWSLTPGTSAAIRDRPEPGCGLLRPLACSTTTRRSRQT